MRNLDFEILKSNYWNLKIFSGLRNESGPKWVGAQMGQGPNELGPKCVGAQMSRGPNESGPKWVGAQMCWGPNESGPKCAGAQMSWGPNVLGPKWVRGPNEDWAQMCPSHFLNLPTVLLCIAKPSNFLQKENSGPTMYVCSYYVCDFQGYLKVGKHNYRFIRFLFDYN